MYKLFHNNISDIAKQINLNIKAIQRCVDKGPKRKPDGGRKIKYEREIIYKINGILHKILNNALEIGKGIIEYS